MEKILDIMLNQVRLDAITKLRNAGQTMQSENQIIRAAKDIMALADLARREGLLALEDKVQNISSDFLQHLIILVVDGNCPEIIAEIATNIYWTKAPNGADAMTDYMFMRGILGIQDGINPRTLEDILLSLMPIEQQQKYQIQMEILHQNKDIEKLFHIHANFQNEGIWKSIHYLEKTISELPNRCIQRLLRELENRDLTICIYVFQQEIRKKILDNLSTGLAQAIMEDVSLCASISEQNVSASILKTLDTIGFLQNSGEIYVPHNI